MKNPKIEYGPTGAYDDVTVNNMVEACGLVLPWLVDTTLLNISAREALDLKYQFGLYEMHGGTITPEGVHQYPSDPDLHPYYRMERGDEVIYQYPHAIVAIIQPTGETFVTRVD